MGLTMVSSRSVRDSWTGVTVEPNRNIVSTLFFYNGLILLTCEHIFPGKQSPIDCKVFLPRNATTFNP